MVWLILGLLIFSRLMPYLLWSVPTGYDGGLYLYLFKNISHLPKWIEMEFSPGFIYFTWPLIKLGIPPESLLIPLQIAAEIFLFGCLYFVVKKLIDKKTALLAVFLLTISAIQFRAFWYFYIKNVWALGLMILALYFLSQKKLVKGLIFTFLTAIFHLATFFMLFLTIVVTGIVTKNRVFYLKIVGLTLLLGGVAYLTNWQKAIMPFLQPLLTISKGSSGSFYNLSVSFLLTTLYLPLAAYGLSLIKKTKSNLQPFFIGTIVCFTWVVMRLFFYNRFFITLNIFLIFWAAIGLRQLMEKYKQYFDIFQFYFGIGIIFILAFIFKTGQPLISKTLFQEVKQFKAEGNASILTTGRDDHAWLLGYSGYPVISWNEGGEDKYWSDEEWSQFFNLDVLGKAAILKKLPQPVYIFINDQNLIKFPEMMDPLCFEPKSQHFYKFSCL